MQDTTITMVTRKPLPEGATVDTAVTSQLNDMRLDNNESSSSNITFEGNQYSLNTSNNNTSSSPLKDAEQEMMQEQVQEQDEWQEVPRGRKQKGKNRAVSPQESPTKQEQQLDDWNLVDKPTPKSSPQRKQQTTKQQVERRSSGSSHQEVAHARSQSVTTTSTATVQQSSSHQAQPARDDDKQNAGMYAIKKITWYDATAKKNPRESPILVQNANGPCPLVALVNALILTTPAEVNTELYHVLRSREQISLGLLLDAVLEELMSPRRTNSDTVLPDIMELHGFLRGLHTGMNVNPRFVPTEEHVKKFKRTSLTHVHPAERGDQVPGTFEETKEMSLYATFNIPLIHGWLPKKSEAAYEAFERSAVSYEDALSLMFREDELENKLSSTNTRLSEDEQQTFQDILIIKSFLETAATQLTTSGLDIMRNSLRPGSVAILFRNDHFSTLYRHPQTLELLTLVTDAGYANHAEIVWESLVDVNGLNAEFFSGDFRLVGGPQSNSHEFTSKGDHHQEWTTVGPKKNNKQPTEADSQASSSREQEDLDLAFALSLQEEEQERYGAEQARRRTESLLSEQYIEQQALQRPMTGAAVAAAARGRTNNGGRNSNASLASPRTSSINQGSIGASSNNNNSNGNVTVTTTGRRTQEVRPLVPPAGRTQPSMGAWARGRPAVNRPADAGLDDAPPTYEQAQRLPKYVPPVGHPTHPASSPRVSSQGAVAGGSASMQQLPATAGGSNSRTGGTTVQTRRQQPVVVRPQENNSKDCGIM